MTEYSHLVKELRTERGLHGHAVNMMRHDAADAIEALQDRYNLLLKYAGHLQTRVEEFEAEQRRLTTIATDRLYMMEAYRSMLGPKGREVAAMWEKQGVTRQHTSWGPEAWKASGEDRAGWLLEIEAAAQTRMEID